MPGGVCEYNVSWMDRTFSAVKRSESLLAPELQNGNLSRRDYDALMRSLPGLHHSEFLGYVVSGAGVFLYSRKTPKLSVGIIGYILGLALGKGLRVYTHTSYFRSIENINGFSQAMDNVKLEIPFQQEADTPYGESPEPSVAVARTPALPASASQAPLAKSRWEEIRAVRRAADGPGKAWENIRQGRKPDGTPLSKQTASETERSESDNGQSWTSAFRDNDRAAEQASFDAMLEKERKMSSS
ncbi:hypothetical protein B0H17DRAFT_132082 [Mycena rosella]|uniref:Uncharacterized protein n=1 Tax=Mycena rosella TaxID=1033263 RepID=A0AAD7D5Y9_MYCRO|nr:hypothetical protein B0H17DRAFT_132082 [Mycena rosella]